MTIRILLVDGDASFGARLRDGLVSQSYQVDWARDSEAAERALDQGPPDLVLLDLQLPGKPGLELLERYRARAGLAPVLIITARSQVEDRIAALDAGADDYLGKPVELSELYAHIRALLRRTARQRSTQIHHRGITLDPDKHEAFLYGAKLDLQRRQFAVLYALMSPPGHVVSRAQLEGRLYGLGDEPGSNPVAVFIYELRQKLGRNVIATVRGIGYKLTEEDAAPDGAR